MAIFTASAIFDLTALAATILALLIAYFKWKLTFWDRVGLPTLNPVIPFGDAKKMLLGRGSIAEQFADFYNAFKARGLKHGGAYIGPKPFYIPTDPELIKHIMQIDFGHFVNHGSYIDEKNDPLSAHLFSLEDAKWRNMRVKLTPTFTSGKMKMMFHTLAECTVGLKVVMDDCAANKEPVDIREILGRFSTDIIGSVAFGIECNSLKNPDSLFRTFGRKVFEVSGWEKMKGFMQFFIPHKILKALKFKITNAEVEKFFMKTVQDTVAYREQNNIYRKDFMQLLLQLKNRGWVDDDEKTLESHNRVQEPALTMNELAAQSFVFFVAGFETSSTTMTFALYELATNPDIQDKLRNEINSVLARYDNQLTYKGIMEMTYMDQVLYETLRKYPPLPILMRQCTKDYILPQTNIRIRKGTDVVVSTVGLHHDPDYFPNPEIFDPERFTEENKKTRPQFTWLPFGEGPRLCIGLRFGMMQSKVGLTTLLKNYTISLNKQTKVPIVFNKNSFITAVEGKVWLDVAKLN